MGVFFLAKRLLLFYAKDRASVLLFLTSILGVIALTQIRRISYNDESIVAIETNEVALAHIDSSRLVAAQPKRYRFNPNFLSPYNAYLWGVSDSSLTALEEFRAKNLWLRSAADFQRVTGVSDSLLGAMAPYFKFPAWTQQVQKGSNFNRTIIKKDLNTASVAALDSVYGIGPVLAGRILNFKERYGAFGDSLQLRLIYGLKPKTRAELLRHFFISESAVQPQFNFNEVSAADLATLPGINFEMAKELVIFRRLRGRVSEPSELLKLNGITEDWLAGIAVYLQFD
ncbi:helix-hairpin-helix domain-containing protein [Gilvibacter sediminis]|uniref:helix-hairpin-helix domain-containing protein n=1 Tax=Gilvibacter sediminis TaxID=379071 RepID=UPI002350A78E|nr:helix-hairpin-helix domain-containing protein [Gilvibacter sediminis]MDC7998449.1 helix-hairpin-helix domain-containing protein [Gilvibacter sediminis]